MERRRITIKTKRLNFRISEEQDAAIRKKAEKAKMSITDYVISAAVKKKIVTIDGLDEVIRQQKAIGRNLNQLTMLCNMGRVSIADLNGVMQQYAEMNRCLTQLLERQR